MPNKVAAATGNWNTAGTWKTCSTNGSNPVPATGVSTQHNISTAATDSPTFLGGSQSADGIVIWIAETIGATGTFTVTLRNVTGGADLASVTLNASDLPAKGGPLYVKFGAVAMSTNNIAVRLVRSVVDSVNNRIGIWRTATANDWYKLITTNAAAAVPAANEHVVIVKGFTAAGTSTSPTITYDKNDNATNHASLHIGSGGTLTFSTAASRALRIGNTGGAGTTGQLDIWDGGVFNMGTSGTPFPSNLTAELVFESGSVAYEVGIVVRNGGTFNAYGAAKAGNLDRTKLAANVAAGGTTITVDDTVNAAWAASDLLAIAQTKMETATLVGRTEGASISSFPASNQIAVAALAYDHSGVAPCKGEVFNLTRNVKIRSATAGSPTAEPPTTPGNTDMWAANVKSGGTINLSWVECRDFGASTTALKRGFEIEGTSGLTTTVSFSRCAFYGCRGMFAYITGAAGHAVTIADCIAYSVGITGGSGLQIAGPTTGTISITGTAIMLANRIVDEACFKLGDIGITFTGNTAIGGYHGFYLLEQTSAPGTFSSLVAHNCGGVPSGTIAPAGFCVVGGVANLVVTGLDCWRCGEAGGPGGAGLLFAGINGSSNLGFGNSRFTNVNLYGNPTNLELPATAIVARAVFDNLKCHGSASTGTGDAAADSARGLRITNASKIELYFLNSDFGANPGTNKTAHTSKDIEIVGTPFVTAWLSNCSFEKADPDDVFNFAACLAGSFARLEKRNALAPGADRRHVSWFREGIVELDTGVTHSAPAAEQLRPNKVAEKLRSGVKQICVADGQTIAPRAWIRKTANYNGNQPRIVLLANPALGIASDTVLATYASGADTWVELIGSATPAAGDDGVMEVVVDCDGTLGSVYVDDWSVP